jgi:type II secretory pathway component PulC
VRVRRLRLSFLRVFVCSNSAASVVLIERNKKANYRTNDELRGQKMFCKVVIDHSCDTTNSCLRSLINCNIGKSTANKRHVAFMSLRV